jgi:sugar lactone lactonase YvrE
MRLAVIPLVALSLACDPAAPEVDAGTDAPVDRPDAGPPVFEVFAELGASSEGIALGENAAGTSTIFVSTTDDRVVQVSPEGVVSDFVTLPGALGIAVRETGELVVCGKTAESDGDTAALFEVALDGTITELARANGEGEPFGLTNFVAIAGDGSLVFSDSAANVVYRAEADGSNVMAVTDTITYPNGLAFSADGATLYVASWNTTTLYAIPFTAGAYGAPTPLIEGIMNVDGIVTTTSGLALITSARGGLLVDPATPSAEPEEIFPSSAFTLPANAVLGDSAFGTTELYVTSLARRDLYVVHTDLMAP